MSISAHLTASFEEVFINVDESAILDRWLKPPLDLLFNQKVDRPLFNIKTDLLFT